MTQKNIFLYKQYFAGCLKIQLILPLEIFRKFSVGEVLSVICSAAATSTSTSQYVRFNRCQDCESLRKSVVLDNHRQGRENRFKMDTTCTDLMNATVVKSGVYRASSWYQKIGKVTIPKSSTKEPRLPNRSNDKSRIRGTGGIPMHGSLQTSL